MYKILVVEDDPSVASELKNLLRSNGYQPVDEGDCDLALLDVGLSGESGFELCRRLRLRSSVPVIFLTGLSGAEYELIGFGVGADDYIVKPYNSSVLLARMARLLKRASPTYIEAKGLKLNPSSFTAEYGGTTVELTRNETRILASLMMNGSITREKLINLLWDGGLYVDDNALSVNINRLRSKLKGVGADGLIRTVRGVGYIF